jgi:hypothetical protein
MTKAGLDLRLLTSADSEIKAFIYTPKSMLTFEEFQAGLSGTYNSETTAEKYRELLTIPNNSDLLSFNKLCNQIYFPPYFSENGTKAQRHAFANFKNLTKKYDFGDFFTKLAPFGGFMHPLNFDYMVIDNAMNVPDSLLDYFATPSN